jgi:site-specific DNA-methyltransferase (adenine-specific)
MRYLITLTTQPGDVVLDPYAGSGTTLVAAKQLGRCYSGAEKTEEYVPIIKARLTVDGAERNGTEPRTKQRRTTH